VQRCGVSQVGAALEAGEDITLVLIDRETTNAAVEDLRQRATAAGIEVIEGSSGDLWRMARDTAAEPPHEILALVGRDPKKHSTEALADGGLVWLLAGARYAQNIGYSIRTAEVSGADAIIIDADVTGEERRTAVRASMRANRFMPVEWADSETALAAASAAGARVVAIEDVGDTEPWQADLTGPLLLVVGGERHGVPAAVLQAADSIIRIPMAGFVPSYNLQAPMAVVAVEALRQRRG